MRLFDWHHFFTSPLHPPGDIAPDRQCLLRWRSSGMRRTSPSDRAHPPPILSRRTDVAPTRVGAHWTGLTRLMGWTWRRRDRRARRLRRGKDEDGGGGGGSSGGGGGDGHGLETFFENFKFDQPVFTKAISFRRYCEHACHSLSSFRVPSIEKHNRYISSIRLTPTQYPFGHPNAKCIYGRHCCAIHQSPTDDVKRICKIKGRRENVQFGLHLATLHFSPAHLAHLPPYHGNPSCHHQWLPAPHLLLVWASRVVCS
jgi:hypothetical protein